MCQASAVTQDIVALCWILSPGFLEPKGETKSETLALPDTPEDKDTVNGQENNSFEFPCHVYITYHTQYVTRPTFPVAATLKERWHGQSCGANCASHCSSELNIRGTVILRCIVYDDVSVSLEIVPLPFKRIQCRLVVLCGDETPLRLRTNHSLCLMLSHWSIVLITDTCNCPMYL